MGGIRPTTEVYILGIGWSELLIVGVVVLIVVGPDKLPQFARSAGRMYGQIRRTAEEMRRALVLEADRQDAEKRYEEMIARRERAEEERRKALEAQPGIAAQQEHLPSGPDSPDEEGTEHGDEEALAAVNGGAVPSAIDPHAAPAGPTGDEELDAFMRDPHGPYGAGHSLDDLMEPLPPGVTAEEWAELPEHIKRMLRERSGGGVG